MITEPTTRNAHLASAWAAGIALLCLGIGLHGASAPLVPVSDSFAKLDAGDDAVMVEAFEPPAAAEDSPPEPETKEEDIAIPHLPQITFPLTPPEMLEITPVAEVREAPHSEPLERKSELPGLRTKPVSHSVSNAPSDAAGGNGNRNSPVLFKGGGNGRFPPPAYPASARSAGQQGTVRLMVTVGASGIPSSIEVTGSSGFPALDNAAHDTVQRRWRWPSGNVRKFIIPIRFIIQ